MKQQTNQKLRERLQKMSIKELAKVHAFLGLDEEYPFSDYECKGDYIMHIFEKDGKLILDALKRLGD